MPPPRCVLSVDDMLQAVVTVRRAQRRLRGTPLGERLHLADAVLTEAIGDVVPKAAAARALAADGAALDRAMRRYGVPRRVHPHGSERARLIASDVIELIDVSQQLTDRGRRGRIVAEAARQIASRPAPAPGAPPAAR
jgi:hypothetical protein